MSDSPKITMYTWKYDDGSWGYAVRKKGEETNWLEYKSYTSKRELAECCKKYSDQSHGRFKKKKIVLAGGLSWACRRYSALSKDGGIDGMLDLLNSCGTTADACRDMLRLVASVLAGYCARVSAEQYMHYLSPLQRRAPIIQVKQAPFAGEVLERVMRSLTLDTTETDESIYLGDGKTLTCNYTPILPKRIRDKTMTDSAFLKLQGYKKRMLPQYRDTAVMIYDWFLRGRDRKRLFAINRWVSLVIYGTSRKMTPTTPVRINGSSLANSSCSWDEDQVRMSVIHYISYIVKKKRSKRWPAILRNQFERYDELISTENQKAPGSIKAAEAYQVSMQLLSLHLFLKSCVNSGSLDEDSAAELETKWYTALLPHYKEKTHVIAHEDEIPTADENEVQETFESALIKILETGFPDRFYMTGHRSNLDLWGDIRELPQKNPPEGIFAIRMSLKQFKQLLDQYGGTQGGQWLYEQAAHLELSYMLPPKKMRIKATGVNESEAIALVLNHMSFLPDSLLSKIMSTLNASDKDSLT